MIAVYCPEERQVGRLHSALAGMSVQRTDLWSVFSDTVGVSACGIVMVDWLAGNPVVERLRSLRVRYPHKPLVLVTRKDADNMRLLRGVTIEEVVWTEEIEHALASTIDRTRQTSVFQGIAATISGAPHLPKRLRHALAHLFQAPNAIATVDELANAVGCDRRTLWRLWRSAIPEETTLRLQDVLDWNVLLHAAILRVQATSWVGIASKLRIHEHTLARSAKRLAGMTLRDVAGNGADGMAELFKQQVLAPLIERRVTNAA
ncbi:MAG TPA: hypothetical protein VM100_04195 [Longimicrobiales bacterium]|nr:hypothetical protein [Longimicrobiales bacterium]